MCRRGAERRCARRRIAAGPHGGWCGGGMIRDLEPTLESGMAVELRQSPDAVRRQAHGLASPVAELVKRLKQKPPRIVVTCARGSSAHAATFGKHLFERHLGIPVAAAAPNIATVYRQRLQLKNQLLLAISQSGRSDDLTEFALMAKAAGALTAAIVNDTDSPLAAAC